MRLYSSTSMENILTSTMEDNAQAENAAQYRFFRRRNKINPEASSNALTGKKVEEDDYNDDIYLEERLDVPEPDGTLFSWRKLWLFTGPGWLSKQLYVHLWITFILPYLYFRACLLMKNILFVVSIAYLDPGNIESDMQSGAIGQYSLLWVLLWATVLGMLFQRLSARIGVVSGKHLAEVRSFMHLI